MPEIISTLNVKGGVGKTITSINLAGEFAKQGHKVLLIDNDSQSSLTQILKLEGKNKFTTYELYSKKVGFDDCIVKFNENISVITNTIDSAILESELHNRMTRESILKNKLNTLTQDFDFIILDNSPFLGVTTINSLAMSNWYMEVIDNSPSALQGLNMVSKIISQVKENLLNKDIKLLGVLRNRFEKKTSFGKQFNEVIEEELKGDVFETIIYDSIKYKEATVMGSLIQDYSPKHAEPYTKVYNEILKRISK